MQVNKFVVVGAIALVSIGAISFFNNAMFQEEKRVARLKIRSAELDCSLLISNEKMLRFAEERLKEASFDNKNSQQKEYYEQKFNDSKKACQAIQEYKDKYEK